MYYLNAIVLLLVVLFSESCKQDATKGSIQYLPIFSQPSYAGNVLLSKSTYVYVKNIEWHAPDTYEKLKYLSQLITCTDSTGKLTIHYINSLAPFNGMVWYHDDLDWQELMEKKEYSYGIIKQDKENYEITLVNSRYKLTPAHSRSTLFKCKPLNDSIREQYHLIPRK